MTQAEKGSESRILQTLLDLLPIAVAIAHDPQGKNISFNTIGVRLLGEDAVQTQTYHITQGGRDLALEETPLLRAITGNEVVNDEEIQYSRSDGVRLNLHVSAAPMHNDAGEVCGGIAVFFDLESNETVQRNILERTAESAARAEQLRELALALADAEARERKRLAQLLHDNFQQLISAAKLKAGIVRRIASDEKIKASAQQIEHLLEEAISASRSLTIELSPPVLYDAGLSAAIEALARTLEKQYALRITPICDPRAEPEAEQVRVLLFEAVRELLNNVVTHAGAKSATIRTGLSSDAQIQITVADDGKGFNFETLSTDPNRSSKPFGLLEIRERLNWIGGDLQIKSQQGVGTKVSMTVPAELRRIKPRLPETIQPLQMPAAVASHAGSNGHRARILVADDHAMFREGLISLLSHEPSFEVIGEAADGQEAVDLARSLKPDILLVDISMPKMSGIEVTSQLSKEMPGMRIVGLSMHERQDMAAAMRSAGAIAYLTKDGSSESLLGVLRTLTLSV